jgi:septal ring factor EnvC (AmiA/AmiB activator)
MTLRKKGMGWDEELCERRHGMLRWSIGVSFTAVGVIALATGWLYQTTAVASALAQATFVAAEKLETKTEQQEKSIDASFDGLSNRIKVMDERQTKAVDKINDKIDNVSKTVDTICGELKARGHIKNSVPVNTGE